MPHPKPKGAIPSPPDERDYIFDAGHYQAPEPEAIPDLIDLRGAIRVFDQGQRPTCVGASLKGLREALHVFGPAQYLPYSASYAYKRANMLSGTLADDNGADPRAALDAMLKFGICPEALAPYATDDDTTPPTQAEDSAAAQWRIGSYHLCPDALQAVQALAAKCPLIYTMRAGPAFDADAENGIYVLSQTTLNDTSTAWNHEQLIMGCTGGADPNVGWWLCQGTWGVNLFNRGYYCVPKAAYSDFFLNPWTASLKKVAAS